MTARTYVCDSDDHRSHPPPHARTRCTRSRLILIFIDRRDQPAAPTACLAPARLFQRPALDLCARRAAAPAAQLVPTYVPRRLAYTGNKRAHPITPIESLCAKRPRRPRPCSPKLWNCMGEAELSDRRRHGLGRPLPRGLESFPCPPDAGCHWLLEPAGGAYHPLRRRSQEFLKLLSNSECCGRKSRRV